MEFWNVAVKHRENLWSDLPQKAHSEAPRMERTQGNLGKKGQGAIVKTLRLRSLA